MEARELAAQGYTIRDYFHDYEEADRSLARVRAIGYAGIQLSAVWHLEPGRLRDLADRHGLAICATHIGWDSLKNDLKTVVAQHRRMGCACVGLGGMPPEARGSADAARAFAREASAIARSLEGEGMAFLYHNHSFEFADLGGGTAIMDILLSECDPAVRFELDTYWVRHGGRDPAALIRQVAGRIPVIHYKDMLLRGGEPVMCEVGEGILDWPGILKASREAGVRWFCVEQDVCERDPFDCLRTSFENLRRL